MGGGEATALAVGRVDITAAAKPSFRLSIACSDTASLVPRVGLQGAWALPWTTAMKRGRLPTPARSPATPDYRRVG